LGESKKGKHEKWSKLESSYSPWFYNTYNILKCCRGGLHTFYYYCPSSSSLIGPLVTQSIAYNTSRNPSSILHHLQLVAFLHSLCLRLAKVPFSLHVTFCRSSSSCFLPSRTNCYFLVAINNLTIQRLP